VIAAALSCEVCAFCSELEVEGRVSVFRKFRRGGREIA
jgi:hypothetical protein